MKTIEFMALETLHWELIEALQAENHCKALDRIKAMWALYEAVWNLLDGMYGGGPGDPIPYGDLPLDRQLVLDEVLELAGNITNEVTRV